MIEAQTLQLVKNELTGITSRQISAVLELMQEGNTVPFIARYRKERTGSLDEVQIQTIEAAFQRATALQDRKAAVLKSIQEQGKLTPKLTQQVNAATKMQDVEDLYLPYKPKRQTKATVARSQGLAPFADWISRFPAEDLRQQARRYVNPAKKVKSVTEVLAGAHEILAENYADQAALRNWVRTYTTKNGKIEVALKPKAKALDEKRVYQQFYDFSARVNEMSPTRTLAINRGEKEKILTVRVTVATGPILQHLHERLIGHHQRSQATQFVTDAYEDSYKRFIGPAIERDLRNELTETADTKSIEVFGKNLYNLLMQAPLKGRVVLGFDPAYRTGCKLAVIDENGKFLTKAVIYPFPPAPAAKRAVAAAEFTALLEQYHVTMIAIGNGTASRESEQFVADTLKKIHREIFYVIVNEAGASVYSASQLARDEFPELQVEQRSAISIGRRLQDPLAELVKIDPESIGVGQYQHDLPAKALASEVDAVVERAVNQVGVDLNTASVPLLTRISGLTKTTATNIVAYRNEHGRYTTRMALQNVPRLGPKAFEQSVGFLRIIGGVEPLDNTDIHPESYGVAKRLLHAANLSTADLGDAAKTATLTKVDPVPLLGTVGAATLVDIVASLQHPGRDLRDQMPAPLLRKDVLTMEDLQPGMELQGTVRNVVDFGAFVDIGVKHDGLVHISRLAKKHVRDASSVVAVGDIVTVWITEVDMERERIELTMIDPDED
ncbi:Tex family protein [Lacticaseibacillus mingshuiensis]|uniref:Tex family protein n=1 Tax=Lacticaseibacillus mingshuiensis TaxID=2799574 RepID=A0ABW4CL45_9LACO|nr:Tex family protein [Lacticaseibacillus mingshuiensis]